MFRLILIVCIASILLMGCEQDRGSDVVDMMTDITTPTETAVEMPEPIVYLTFEGETYEVFTSADAAINSERFRMELQAAKEWNSNWCDKDGVPELDAYAGPAPNAFEFLDEVLAEEFVQKINLEYSEHLRTSETVYPPHLEISWWGFIEILPSCL